MKKLLLLLFLIPNLVMAEDSKWKRQAKPSEQPTINIEEETDPQASQELQSKPLKNKKTLTLYDCADTESVEKGFWNAKECNQNCKKTKRLMQFKVNQQYNQVLLIETYEDGSTYEKILKSDGTSVADAQRSQTYYKILEIFDEDHWEFTAGQPGRYKRTHSFKNGKWASYIWQSKENSVLNYGLLPYQECGK